MTTGGAPRVKSADRTVELLELLAASPARRTLVELVRYLEIPKSSMHGLLRTLVKRGWVETDSAGLRYGLGVQVLRTGAAYLRTDRAVVRLTPVIDRLHRELDATVQLSRLVNGQMVALVTRERFGVPPAISEGSYAAADTSTPGKAVLAQLCRDQVSLLQFLPTPTKLSPANFDALTSELAWVLDHGYAVDQIPDDYCCVAVRTPSTLSPYDAVSVSVPKDAFLDSGASEIAYAVTAAIREGLAGRTDQR